MQVCRRLSRRFPGTRFSLRRITTLGDRVKDWSRDAKGIFVKEIEDELLAGKIDIAVHSAKDMPSQITSGLYLAAVTRREDPRDVIISRPGKSLVELPRGALVGTTSLRRQAQVLCMRPDLRVEGLRGNLDTRVRKLDEGMYDAIIVARAGLRRLGICHPGMRVIPESMIIPACGQGALAIEARVDDRLARRICASIDDPAAHVCVECERAFLRQTGGGCRLPVAVRARLRAGRVYLTGLISSVDGTSAVRVTGSCPSAKAEVLAVSLAKRALENGGAAILAEIEDEKE
jgi:hydroxymethylbilane synthase